MRRTLTCLLLAALVGLALAQSVTLDWDDNLEADLSHYIVYRGVETGVLWPMSVYVPSIAEILTSTYVDTSVQTDSTYFYAVTAVDDSDNESSQSSEISVTLDFTAPDTSSFSAVVFDTTNASNVRLDLAAVADEAALASWQWREAYDGTWTPTSDQWVATDDHSDTTFATSLSDTIYTTLATSAMDSAQIRFRLKDANQNVSDWYGPFDNAFVRDGDTPVLWVVTNGGAYTLENANPADNDTVTVQADVYIFSRIIAIDGTGDFTHTTIDVVNPAVSGASATSMYVEDDDGFPLTSGDGEQLSLYYSSALADSLASATVDSGRIYFRNGSEDANIYVGILDDDTVLGDWDSSADDQASYSYQDVGTTTAWTSSLDGISALSSLGSYDTISALGITFGPANTTTAWSDCGTYRGTWLYTDSATEIFISHDGNDTPGNRPVELIWAVR